MDSIGSILGGLSNSVEEEVDSHDVEDKEASLGPGDEFPGGKDFGIVARETFREVSMDIRLSKADSSVYFAMGILHNDWRHRTHCIACSDIMAETGLGKTQVYGSQRKLLELGYIERHPEGRGYYVVPWVDYGKMVSSGAYDGKAVKKEERQKDNLLKLSEKRADEREIEYEAVVGVKASDRQKLKVRSKEMDSGKRWRGYLDTERSRHMVGVSDGDHVLLPVEQHVRNIKRFKEATGGREPDPHEKRVLAYDHKETDQWIDARAAFYGRGGD